MEAIILLMSAIALIAFAFIYKSKTDRKKKRNRIKNKISEASLEHNLEWSHVDIGLYRGIAWSAEKRKLFSVDMAREKETTQWIDMDNILACNLVESGHSGIARKTIHTTSVELQFTPRDKGAVIAIPFYQEEIDGIYEKILLTQKAQHWKSILSK